METIRLKIVPSSINAREGSVFFSITHNQTEKQFDTGCKIYLNEWDNIRSKIIIPPTNNERTKILKNLKKKIREQYLKLKKVLLLFEERKDDYTPDDIISTYHSFARQDSFYFFMRHEIEYLKSVNRIRSAETYAATLRSFMRFRKERDLRLDQIDSKLMLSYESYLKELSVTKNTSSFYMRNLRAVYNRAVHEGLVCQKYPFKKVYTGINKTIKRAVTIREIRKIKKLQLGDHPCQEYARDLFLFSFYTRGMAFVDMAYLKKEDLKDGVLTYERKKTGQRLFIRWEKCMQEIVEKYTISDSPYLLPIIKCSEHERKQYLSANRQVNRQLKLIGQTLGLSMPLSMYVARHSWASAARDKNVPIAVISEGMGHDSQATTEIYLSSLKTDVVDRANKLILKDL